MLRIYKIQFFYKLLLIYYYSYYLILSSINLWNNPWWGSNPRSSGSKPDALSIWPQGQYYSNSNKLIKFSTTAGFEPARAEPNGLAVHRLNHSAKLSLLIILIILIY